MLRALEADATYGTRLNGHSPQGSWAHHDEFDADFLLHVEAEPAWEGTPKEHLRELPAAFRRHSTYKSMVEKKNRCVRVVYANSCHIDVVPCVREEGSKVIVNYADDTFEETNPPRRTCAASSACSSICATSRTPSRARG